MRSILKLAAWLLTTITAISHADTLLVVRKSADALDFVDPGSGRRLASVAVGFGPHEVSVAPDGRHAVVSNYGTREQPGASVSIVDLVEARELRRIDLQPHTRPHGVDWYATDRVAVTTEGSQSLLLVDPFAGKVVQAARTAQDVSHMVAVAPGGRRAFVANIGSGSLTAIDLTQPEATPRTIALGAGVEGIAVRPDGQQVWALARADGALSRLDATTLERLGGTIAVPGIPIRVAFSPEGTRAYVTRAGLADVLILDGVTGEPLAQHKIDVPLAAGAESRPFAKLAAGSPLPVGLVVAPDGRSLYVAATMADRVVQLDATTLEVLRTIEVGGEPDGLALTPVMPRATCHACTPETTSTHR